MKYRNIRTGTVVEARQITNKDRDGIDYDISETAIFVNTSNGKSFYDPGDYLVEYNWGHTSVLPCDPFQKEWIEVKDEVQKGA